MVQTFSADRPDHTFHVSALPRRARGAKNFFDIHDFDLLAELLPVDPITISQQIFRCGVERKGFQHLLRGPFPRGMSHLPKWTTRRRSWARTINTNRISNHTVWTVKKSTEASCDT